MADSTEELSARELRSKIFSRFKNKGILDSVKAQLRKQIAFELNRDYKSIQPDEKKFNSLHLHICDSIFADHLQKVGYDYTLSVFQSEGTFLNAKSLSVEEIFEVFSLEKDAKVYIDIVENVERNGILLSILSALTHLSNRQTSDSAIQTNHDAFVMADNIHEKLSLIEKDSMKKYQNITENDKNLITAKLMSLEKKYEEEKQEQLKIEIEKFKLQEINAIKREERNRYDDLMSKMKIQLEEEHNQKMKEVNRLWDELKHAETNQLKDMEKEGFEKRQKMLHEMQILKDREAEMKLLHNNAIKAVELREEKAKHFEEQLKIRETSLSQNEKLYQEKLQTEIMRMKIQMEQDNKRKIEDIQEQERIFKSEKLSFDSQKQMLVQTKHDSDALKLQSQHLKASFDGLQREYATLKQNYVIAQEKLQKFSNYEEMKTENEVLKHEIVYLQREQEVLKRDKIQSEKESKKLVKELLEKVSKVNVEYPRINEFDVSKERDFYQRKCGELREELELVQKKYELEVTKQRELQKHNDDLLLTEKEMAREIEALQEELRRAKRAQDKSVVVRPMSFIQYEKPTKGVLNTSYKRLNKPSSILKKSVVVPNEHETTSLDSANHHMNNLAKLEREAEELEKSYKDFLKRDKFSNSLSLNHLTSKYPHEQSTINKYLHERSTINTGSTETLYISSLLPNTLVPSYHSLPNNNHPSDNNNPLFNTSTLNTNKDGAPLSSTQAPSGLDVPSIGLSGFSNHELYQKNKYSSGNNSNTLTSNNKSSINVHYNSNLTNNSNTQISVTENQLIKASEQIHTPSVTIHDSKALSVGEFGSGMKAAGTCYSLSQYPLAEPSVFTESITQYPLNDAITPKITPQFQQLKVTSEHAHLSPLQTNNKRKLETVAERSDDVFESDHVIEHVSTDHERLDSVEQDYNLNEASILTFESPQQNKESRNFERNIIKQDEPVEKSESHENDFIVKSNEHLNAASDIREIVDENSQVLSINDKEGDASNIDSVQSEYHNSMKESNHSSATISREMNVDDLKSKSEGELKNDDSPKQGNLLNEYMRMVLNQRAKEESAPDQKEKEKSKSEGELYQYDLSVSEDVSSKSPSEKSSEFEW